MMVKREPICVRHAEGAGATETAVMIRTASLSQCTGIEPGSAFAPQTTTPTRSFGSGTYAPE